MRESLDNMKSKALQDILSVQTSGELQQVRQNYLGKKGELTVILKELSKLEPDERRTIGALANEVKDALNEAIQLREEALLDEASAIQAVCIPSPK